MREINLALALAGIGAERQPPFQEEGAAGEGGGAEGREWKICSDLQSKRISLDQGSTN